MSKFTHRRRPSRVPLVNRCSIERAAYSQSTHAHLQCKYSQPSIKCNRRHGHSHIHRFIHLLSSVPIVDTTRVTLI